MKRQWLVFGASMTFVIFLTFWLKPVGQKSGDAVQVQFIGMTNDPALGPVALICVTNRAVSSIICAKSSPQVRSLSGWVDVDDSSPSGLGYLQRGECYVFSVPAPAGTKPWRVPVIWQRQDLSRSETFVNRQHRLLLERVGKQPSVDALVPFSHVVYSPEIAR